MTDKELTCLLSLPIVEGQWDSVTTHYQSESLKKAILELPEPDLIIQHLPFPLVSCFLLQSLNTLEEGSSSQGSQSTPFILTITSRSTLVCHQIR